MSEAIAAIATARGQGGIGIVRISGSRALEILKQVFVPRSPSFGGFRPWTLHRGTVLDAENQALDDVLAVYMPAPHTFTGEDVAEIHCHGGMLIVQMVLESVLKRGASQARRGEFSRRAFLNGRMDLSQAEAVAEMIAAPSREALRYSLNRLDGRLGQMVREFRAELDELRMLALVGVDFPDEEVPQEDSAAFCNRAEQLAQKLAKLLRGVARAEAMQQGAAVVLAGPVNAGKSSLLNALCGQDRALVTDIPGTTRDFLEARLNLDGLPLRLIDSAGLRDAASADSIESLGMDRSRRLIAEADLVLAVADCAAPEQEAMREILELAAGRQALLVFNKCDLAPVAQLPPGWPELPFCAVSALTGENLEQLSGKIRQMLLAGEKGAEPENDLAPNRRQALSLEQARGELVAMREEAANGATLDCCLARLDTVAAQLDEVLGLASHDQLLDNIFSSFCIGK